MSSFLNEKPPTLKQDRLPSHRANSEHFNSEASPDKVKPHLVRMEGAFVKNTITLRKVDVVMVKQSLEGTIKQQLLSNKMASPTKLVQVIRRRNVRPKLKRDGSTESSVYPSNIKLAELSVGKESSQGANTDDSLSRGSKSPKNAKKKKIIRHPRAGPIKKI